MHGVVFISLRDYLDASQGPAAAAELLAGEPEHLLTESYPDERLLALVGRAAAAAGRDVDATLHDFGVFTAQSTFVRLYPAFFALAPTTRDFLLTVETRIHELVRATIPHASPPRLSMRGHGEDGVRIEYRSPRRLCRMLHGLVAGTAAHYGERAEIEEPACMRRDDEACVFLVSLLPL